MYPWARFGSESGGPPNRMRLVQCACSEEHFDGTSVAEVRFSPVLPPFLENRELNWQVWAGTEPELELNRIEPVLSILLCSVPG